MVELKSFEDVNRELKRFIPSAGKVKEPYSLERIRTFLGYLGNPQNQYKVIHVAGTSGKTSTCYYLASILKEHNKKVGMTISPHVDEINERVQIDLKPLPEKEFCKQLSTFLELVEKSATSLTYFELLVAFAFWQFANKEVDYAVVEVGMGGLLDGTNVITRDDKICVITDIGLDHTEVLGETLAKITAQKAGIIQPHNEVFTHKQADEIMEVMRTTAAKQQAKLNEIDSVDATALPQALPLFQQHNWYLAFTVGEWLAKRDSLKPLNAAQLVASTEVYIPARMEVIPYDGQTIIVDGSHNVQKLQVLVDSIDNRFPDQQMATLVSFVQRKEQALRNNLEVLLPKTSHLIVTTFAGAQDLPNTSVDPTKIAEQCKQLGFINYEIIANPEEAFTQLISRPEPILLITGSFYLLNHIRPLLLRNKSPQI